MSKAFTKENDDAPEDDFQASSPGELPLDAKNYVTPRGHGLLTDEWNRLANTERPEAARLTALAQASNQTLELQTLKSRQRQIDRRIQYLQKRIENAEVVDGAKRARTDRVYFGATVNYITSKGVERIVSIVGVDEADAPLGRISYQSPLAKALIGAREGDVVTFQSPGGVDELEIAEVRYLP